MLAKRGWLAFFAIAWLFVLLISATISHAQVSYTTTWVGNTYSTIPTYVGNAMRSMWVAPEGVVYTASDWDESQGGINVYQNGHKIKTFAAHGEPQGGAITGDSTYLFAPLQFNTTLGGNGFIARYNRSTGTRDLTWSASSDTAERRADVITGIADTGTLVYVSDNPDNLVRTYTTAGVWQSDWSLTDPGAIAIDGSGNIWVAQKNEGKIQEFSPSGSVLNTINMGSSARPSALYFDSANNQLMVGDQGPNMNIQIYGNLSSTPSLVGTFGVQGGYLDTTTGNKGQTGSKRFTRVVGIGKDTSGNLYVLNNPWGGTWDLGRNGKTDLHAYNSSGVLQYTLQALNFEGNAAFDPGTDGAYLYSGQDVYSGLGGGGYVGNSVDALDNPTDARVDVTSASRGFDFGLMTSVNGHRILAAAGQNSDAFLFSYFPTNQYVSVPFGSLPGQASAAGYNYSNYFNTTARIRNGFCLDVNGDIWVGLDKTNAITHYPLTGFDANGLPIWGTPTTTPTPSTIAPLGGIEYIPSTDTMVLMNGNGTDWTSLGGRVEVYHGWKAGHTTNPDRVINLKTSQNPKGRTAAGNYLFISYVHTVPDIDAYNLTTGADDLTMTSADPNVVVGNDVDSMYGIRAYQTSTGDYLISKDNYNEQLDRHSQDDRRADAGLQHLGYAEFADGDTGQQHHLYGNDRRAERLHRHGEPQRDRTAHWRDGKLQPRVDHHFRKFDFDGLDSDDYSGGHVYADDHGCHKHSVAHGDGDAGRAWTARLQHFGKPELADGDAGQQHHLHGVDQSSERLHRHGEPQRERLACRCDGGLQPHVGLRFRPLDADGLDSDDHAHGYIHADDHRHQRHNVALGQRHAGCGKA